MDNKKILLLEKLISEMGFTLYKKNVKSYIIKTNQVKGLITLRVCQGMIVLNYYLKNENICSFGIIMSSGKIIRYNPNAIEFNTLRNIIVKIIDVLNIPKPTKVY